SSGMSTMAGEQPVARSALAVKFMTTEFVMHCTNGAASRTAATCCPTTDGENVIWFIPSLVRARAGSMGVISAGVDAPAPLVHGSGYAIGQALSKPRRHTSISHRK